MIEEIKEFVIQWNINYPVDKWWRQKHKIAFNSPDHRVVSFIDMIIEYEEEQMFNDIKPVGYIPNIGDWWNGRSEQNDDNLTDQERITKYKDEFKKMNLEDYDG